TASFDRTAIYHDIQRPRVVGPSRLGNAPIDIGAVSDAGRVLTVDNAGAVAVSVQELDARAPEWALLEKAGSGRSRVAISADGSRVTVAKEKGGASIYASPKWDLPTRIDGGPFTALAYGADALA